jgi:hypothetical protein
MAPLLVKGKSYPPPPFIFLFKDLFKLFICLLLEEGKILNMASAQG